MVEVELYSIKKYVESFRNNNREKNMKEKNRCWLLDNVLVIQFNITKIDCVTWLFLTRAICCACISQPLYRISLNIFRSKRYFKYFSFSLLHFKMAECVSGKNVKNRRRLPSILITISKYIECIRHQQPRNIGFGSCVKLNSRHRRKKIVIVMKLTSNNFKVNCDVWMKIRRRGIAIGYS